MRIPLKEVVLAKSQDKEHWNCEVAFIVESQNVDFNLIEKSSSYFCISSLIDRQLLNDLGFFDTGSRPVRIIETLKIT